MAVNMDLTEVTLDYYNDEGERVRFEQEVPYAGISLLISLMETLAEDPDRIPTMHLSYAEEMSEDDAEEQLRAWGMTRE